MGEAGVGGKGSKSRGEARKGEERTRDRGREGRPNGSAIYAFKSRSTLVSSPKSEIDEVTRPRSVWMSY